MAAFPTAPPAASLVDLLDQRKTAPTLDMTAGSSFGGTTPPAPDPTSVRPRVNAPPMGRSGRAHFAGLIEQDESNPQLRGTAGLWQWDQMYEQDAHVRRLVLMISSPIQAGTWNLEPYGGDQATAKDKDVADTLWWALAEYMSPNFFEHLMAALPVLIRSGFAPFEQIWKTVKYPKSGKTLILPRKLDLRLPRTIWKWYQDDDGELDSVAQILPNAANVIIPASELVYYRLQSEGDNWMGRSMLRQCYRSWYFKWHLEELEAIGLERKAVGVPIVYPPQNLKDEGMKDEVETIFANLHVNEVGYVVMPGPSQQYDKDNGWHVEIVKFDSSSGGEIDTAINRHSDAMAASFLGDFMSLGHHQVGARATAEVQQDPFLTAVSGLTEFVLSPLNRLLARMTELNFTGVDGPPKLKCTITDQASLSEIATYVQLLVASGAMQADPELEDYLRQRADMPPANMSIRQASIAAKMQGLQQAANPPEPMVDSQGNPVEQKPGQPAKPAAAAQNDPDLKTGADPKGSTNTGGKPKPTKALADGQVDPKWFEQLLAKDQLGAALDGTRDRMTATVQPAVMTFAHKAAYQASNGQHPTSEPSVEMVDAFHQALGALYDIGRSSVAYELARQRTQLGKQPVALMTPSELATAAGARSVRVRQRAEIAARTTAQGIASSMSRAITGGATSTEALQRQAEREATGQLAVQGQANAMDMINAGRFDTADAQAADIVQAQYTSCMDDRTCESCSGNDGTIYNDIAEAEAAVPNGECFGGPGRCRCTVVFMLSSDPRAFAGLFAT